MPKLWRPGNRSRPDPGKHGRSAPLAGSPALRGRHRAVASPDRKRRFVQEAKSVSALNHAGIIHIYDIDTANLPDGPTAFIAMEFVPGKTLDQWIGKPD
jgi:serine/threonine protein kinase